MENNSIPTFDLGKDGFPVPGKVVRYYRERMVYTDTNGKVKHWTQADLAKRLGVSEIMVRQMEKQNKGLGNIERRRTLATLLNIPFALLGLASVDDLKKIIEPSNTASLVPLKKELVSSEEKQLYKVALTVLKEKYDGGQLHPFLIEDWIKRINKKVESTQGTEKRDLLLELCKYHILASNPYYHDLQDWQKAVEHLQAAKEMAVTLNDNQLFATACYYMGETYLVQNKPLLATRELEPIIPLCEKQIKGLIMADLSLAHALANNTNISYIRNLLDKAERHISERDDNIFIRFDTVQHLECKADTLISLQRFELALDCIDDAEEYINARPNIIRNTEYLKLLRAECYAKQSKPEYEETIRLLSQIVNDNSYIGYYVNYASRIHKIIAASSYGKAPAVVDLGIQLKLLHK